MRNFRAAYYTKIGFQDVGRNSTFDALFKENGIDLQVLRRACEKYAVPDHYRSLVWKVLLGLFPPNKLAWEFVHQTRLEQYSDIAEGIRLVMHCPCMDLFGPHSLPSAADSWQGETSRFPPSLNLARPSQQHVPVQQEQQHEFNFGGGVQHNVGDGNDNGGSASELRRSRGTSSLSSSTSSLATNSSSTSLSQLSSSHLSTSSSHSKMRMSTSSLVSEYNPDTKRGLLHSPQSNLSLSGPSKSTREILMQPSTTPASPILSTSSSPLSGTSPVPSPPLSHVHPHHLATSQSESFACGTSPQDDLGHAPDAWMHHQEQQPHQSPQQHQEQQLNHQARLQSIAAHPPFAMDDLNTNIAPVVPLGLVSPATATAAVSRNRSSSLPVRGMPEVGALERGGNGLRPSDTLEVRIEILLHVFLIYQVSFSPFPLRQFIPIPGMIASPKEEPRQQHNNNTASTAHPGTQTEKTTASANAGNAAKSSTPTTTKLCKTLHAMTRSAGDPHLPHLARVFCSVFPDEADSFFALCAFLSLASANTTSSTSASSTSSPKFNARPSRQPTKPPALITRTGPHVSNPDGDGVVATTNGLPSLGGRTLDLDTHVSYLWRMLEVRDGILFNHLVTCGLKPHSFAVTWFQSYFTHSVHSISVLQQIFDKFIGVSFNMVPCLGVVVLLKLRAKLLRLKTSERILALLLSSPVFLPPRVLSLLADNAYEVYLEEVASRHK